MDKEKLIEIFQKHGFTFKNVLGCECFSKSYETELGERTAGFTFKITESQIQIFGSYYSEGRNVLSCLSNYFDWFAEDKIDLMLLEAEERINSSYARKLFLTRK